MRQLNTYNPNNPSVDTAVGTKKATHRLKNEVTAIVDASLWALSPSPTYNKQSSVSLQPAPQPHCAEWGSAVTALTHLTEGTSQ